MSTDLQCPCSGGVDIRRRKTVSSVELVYQCVKCDRVIGKVPARVIYDLDGEVVDRLPWVKKTRKRMPNSRKRAYQEALKSPHWRQLKKLVNERSGGLCERKAWGCTGRATELGHKNYERLGRELPEDVEDCCRSCNQEERRERITRHVLG